MWGKWSVAGSVDVEIGSAAKAGEGADHINAVEAFSGRRKVEEEIGIGDTVGVGEEVAAIEED